MSNQIQGKRKYQQKRRAEQLEETRRRITAATIELHRTIGPAATRVTEIARRAAVQRATVYNHFPDEASLFAACSAHWRALHPAPDPVSWRATAEAGARLRLGLAELYRWYRETEPMTANVLRDAEVVAALRPIVENGFGAYLAAAQRALAEPFAARGRTRQRIEGATRVATAFQTWRALSELGDEPAADLAAGLIELAAA